VGGIVFVILVAYFCRGKLRCGGAQQDVSSPPTNSASSSAVEMSNYVRAPLGDEAEWGESSSHPLTMGKEQDETSLASSSNLSSSRDDDVDEDEDDDAELGEGEDEGRRTVV
jgi:hypothetical protein